MKKIIIFLAILFLTGCNVKYDLTITNKEEVKENFYVYIDNSKMLESYKTIDEYLDYYSNVYKENFSKENYNIKTKESSPQSYFLVKNKYKDLDEYTKSTSFLSLFSGATIERVGSYTTFTTATNTYLNSIKNDTLLSADAAEYQYTINIKFYNEVVDSNADKIDEKNNIYTWNIDKNTTKDFIYFKISSKVKYGVMIKDFIVSNIVSFIIILSAITIVSVSGIFIYIKARKNNEV